MAAKSPFYTLVAALKGEAAASKTWQPVTATATMAMHTKKRRAGHVWMTREEFALLMERYFPERSRRAGQLQDATGITKTRRKAIVEGALIAKYEAMALAHWTLGLPDPLAGSREPADFRDWFYPRFGSAEGASGPIGVNENTIRSHLNGYVMAAGARSPRRPSITVIRALDWCWRVGPFSPYGERLPSQVLAGNEETPQ